MGSVGFINWAENPATTPAKEEKRNEKSNHIYVWCIVGKNSHSVIQLLSFRKG